MNQEIIEKTIEFLKKELDGAEGGHDWWHAMRVWKLSKELAKQEGADMLVVELAALLHDVADHKFNGGDEQEGLKKASEFLRKQRVEEAVVTHVENIIANISFKGGREKRSFTSPELDVVQDADRLDAMGAIGIARAFNYGGYKNREMYNPSIPPQLSMSKEQYLKSTSPTINHFYEKLLLLASMMNTPAGKAMADQRHKFMELFLEHFFAEWEGKPIYKPHQ